jgi:hypothetical protein
MSLTDKPGRGNHPPSPVPFLQTGGPPKNGWRVRQWSDSTGCSVPTTYRRIRDGSLKVRKYGGLTLILGFADEQV